MPTGIYPHINRPSFEWKHTPKAKIHPSNIIIAWAAGIIEGEGSFYRHKGSQTVSASQKELDVLFRLQEIFGGNITRAPKGIHQWKANGARARGIMMTIYLFMTHRRKIQIRKALGREQRWN